MDTRQVEEIVVDKRVLIGSDWPRFQRQVQGRLKSGEPFMVVGTKSRARKMITRLQAEHPEIPVQVIARMDRTAPWVAVVGVGGTSAFRMLSEGGPIESIIVTPTPTMADQVAAARRAQEMYYGQP